jgi:hypothetical protein
MEVLFLDEFISKLIKIPADFFPQENNVFLVVSIVIECEFSH